MNTKTGCKEPRVRFRKVSHLWAGFRNESRLRAAVCMACSRDIPEKEREHLLRTTQKRDTPTERRAGVVPWRISFVKQKKALVDSGIPQDWRQRPCARSREKQHVACTWEHCKTRRDGFSIVNTTVTRQAESLPGTLCSSMASVTTIAPCLQMKWNESGFGPPLCTYRLNWARIISWGWWDDTALQTQGSKFKSWRSEAVHATFGSRRLPTILRFASGWGRNIFVLNPELKGSGANHYPRSPVRVYSWVVMRARVLAWVSRGIVFFRCSNYFHGAICACPRKHKTLLTHLYNVWPTSKTLGRRCINFVQMLCLLGRDPL